MTKLALKLLSLLLYSSEALQVNSPGDKGVPSHTSEYIHSRNLNLRHQSALDLDHKKYKDFDMKDEEIPWSDMDRVEMVAQLRKHVDLHQSPNKSSINWGGIPDSLVEKMKEQDVMPTRGIPNRIMMLAPFEPKWFREFNQKQMPNNTEFIVYDYNKMDEEISLISKEMEKLGIHGAERAFKLNRPYANKKNFLQWMALWQHGGIFMDAKMGFTQPVSNWVDFQNDELVGCADPVMITDDQFIMMSKHHPAGLMMVQHHINNVNNRAYYDGNGGQWYSDLNITGPDAYRDMLITSHQGTWTNFRCIKELNTTRNQYTGYLIDGKGPNGIGSMLYQNDPVPSEQVFFAMKDCKTCNNYKTLMRNRQIYCDQPGPTIGCDGQNYTYFQDENTWKNSLSINEDWASINQDKEYNQTAVAQEKLLMHQVYSNHGNKDKQEQK